MGRKCCVPKCSSNYDAVLRRGQSTISTFKFPEDKHLRDLWITALNRDPSWQPGSTASICINHFQPEDILRYDKPAKLKPDAVPSIFSKSAKQGPVVKRGRPKRGTAKLDALENFKNDDKDYLNEEHIDPADNVMKEMILGFDNFRQRVSENMTTDNWHYYESANVLHFYNITEQDADSAIRIENSIKVYDDMKIKLFLKDVKQADESLRWILDHDMKLLEWSQFETLLQKYDSKVYRPREDPADQFKQQTNESEMLNHDEDSQIFEEEYLDQSEDGEVEFLEIDEHIDVENEVGTNRNPLRIQKDRSRTVQERAERKNVREIAQKLKNSKHRCFICDKEHDSSEEFERHLTIHADMLPFHCDRCISETVTIKTLASLNKHLLMHQKPLKCRTCDVRFSNYGTRLLHEQNSHENRGPFTCEVCGKISQSLRGHQHHFKIHTNPESMKCQLCGKQLSSSYELKLHMRIHTKEKPNKCPFCPISFNRISNLVVHKRRLHGTEKPFRCSLCEELFGSDKEWKRHLTTHDPEPSTNSKENPIRHVGIVQSNEGNKDHYCKACNKLLPNASAYHSHMRKHRKRYQCSYCGLRIGQFRDFIDHENTHTGKRPYKCEVCAKTFKTSSTYYGHRAVHSTEKRFNCEFCGRRFNRLRHLVIHKKVHKAEFADRACHLKLSASSREQTRRDSNLSTIESANTQQILSVEECGQVTITVATPLMSEPQQIPRVIQTTDGSEAILVTADMLSTRNLIILQQPENTGIET
ncbi:AAEL008860-PA [Aedes aegypti]|uniref:AAEL008860-PA n=1 Tax=Aedes aegypti TaxID=7159 RepID=Q16XI0_AEDAE|nr:AAEL008860-PA [Aedes aegypti]